MGAEIFVKYMDIEDLSVILQIWDIGGEELFQFLLPTYSSGSAGAIFMFDVTRYKTITEIGTWLKMFNEGLKSDEKKERIPIIMVGGKIDLKEQRTVSHEESEKICQAHDLYSYIECSSVTGENVGVIFEDITRVILKNHGFI